MKAASGKTVALLVAGLFLAVIGAWIWIVGFAREHGDVPIPLPAREQRP